MPATKSKSVDAATLHEIAAAVNVPLLTTAPPEIITAISDELIEYQRADAAFRDAFLAVEGVCASVGAPRSVVVNVSEQQHYSGSAVLAVQDAVFIENGARREVDAAKSALSLAFTREVQARPEVALALAESALSALAIVDDQFAAAAAAIDEAVNWLHVAGVEQARGLDSGMPTARTHVTDALSTSRRAASNVKRLAGE